MMLTIDTRVQFYEYGHKYLLDGQYPLIGVTSLMSKHGLSANYAKVDKDTLDHAAALGTQAHKAIEDYCNGKAVVETPLIKSFKKLGLKVICCEYLVSDDSTVASKIDIVSETGENSVALIDTKRTSSVHKDALAWQLGIYRYLFELMNPTMTVSGCYCLPIKKGNKDDILADTCKPLVPIEPVDREKVEALIMCETMGTLYDEAKADPLSIERATGFGSVAVMTDLLNRMQVCEAAVKEVKTQLDAYRETLYGWMVENNVDELSSGGLVVKLKRPYQREGIDTKRLKEKYPQIAEELKTSATVAGNVTLSIKQ